MTALPVLQPPRLPAGPDAPFRCEHYRCTLSGSACIARQTERWRPGLRSKSRAPRVPPGREFCAGGACEQGRAVASALGATLQPLVVRGGWGRGKENGKQRRAFPVPASGVYVLRSGPVYTLPAPPPVPKEEPMPCPASPLDKLTDAQVRAAFEKHGPSVNAAALKLGVSWGTLKSRLARMGIGSAARRLTAQRPEPKPTPAPPPRAKPNGRADGDQPIEELLRSRLDHHREKVAELLHHQDEAAKLERALAALLNATS